MFLGKLSIPVNAPRERHMQAHRRINGSVAAHLAALERVTFHF
jgi:hypothetical protein